MNDTWRTHLPEPLISVAQLAADRRRPISILDVQFVLGDRAAGRAAFEHRHLPTAQFCDLDTVLSGRVGAVGGRHPLPDPIQLQADLRQLGLCNTVPVVVYDAGDGFAAARCWWILRWAGHRNVRILDGGLQSWVKTGQPTDGGWPSVVDSGDIVVVAGSMPTLDAQEAGALAASGVLLDARAAARFRGEVEPVDAVAGHIPGARNAPTTDNLDDEGHYLRPAQLRARFAELGAEVGEDVGAYCGSGVSAAQEIVALQLAGVSAALYVGSWSDWISNTERPIGTGEQGIG